MPGQQATEVIEPLKQLDIAFQAVDKRTVEHMPANLRQRRLLSVVVVRLAGLKVRPARVAAHPHHQHPVGSQMQRRTDWRRLPHCAIAKILFADFDRGKQKRDGRTGQQMFNRQSGGHADAPMAQPAIDGALALIKGHRLTGRIAKCSNRDSPQVMPGNRLFNTGEVDPVLEQIAQGRTVEQRHRHMRA